MILHWQQLPLYYGDELSAHAARFEQAGETTHALLCCRFAPSNERHAASSGDHAERKLLSSSLWVQEIPAAMGHWYPGDRSRIVVTLAINRSPCRDCTEALVEALYQLQWRFAQRFEHCRFILASRGAYQGRLSERDFYESATTVGDLSRLRDVGWELCVLQTGSELPPSGRELQQAIQTLCGTGFVRLEG